MAGRRSHALAIEIKPILRAVRRLTLFKGVCLFGRGDTESIKRQDHCTNTDVRLSGFADVPTPRTLKKWGTDLPLGSNVGVAL